MSRDKYIGGGFVDGGELINGKENREKEGYWIPSRIRFEHRVDVDDKGRTNGAEQTGLRINLR